MHNITAVLITVLTLAAGFLGGGPGWGAAAASDLAAAAAPAAWAGVGPADSGLAALAFLCFVD